MTVYHINKAIGHASSGVEYAQKYRDLALQSVKMKQRFIFTDYLGTNLIYFTTLLGLNSEDIIGIYSFLANQQNHLSTYALESFEKQLIDSFQKKELPNQVVYTIPNSTVSYRVWLINEKFVDRVDVLHNQKLIRAEHYSDRLTNTEYYSNGQVISRTFFTEDGKVAYRQYYENREISLTVIDDKILIGRNAFFQEFFRRLNWNSEDCIILDRSTELADAVFPQANGARIGIPIHAEHYNLAYSNKNRVLWNNFYEYVFENDKYVTWYITATEEQAVTLKKHFKLMHKDTTKIHAISVGCITPKNTTPSKDSKYDLLTVSRLASEKHLDLLIEAVASLKKKFPQLTLSIYGEGGLRSSLQQLITKLDADDYIFLKGHQEMDEHYPNYGGYITASYSEGFGLTLLEAIAYSIPMVGFQVPYGNTEFIKDGVNGYLVKKESTEKQNIANLAKGISKLLSNSFNSEKSTAFSQKKAAEYTIEKIGEKWNRLFLENIKKEDTHEYFTS
ncbi:glycosyltransferase [Listeria innocua]|uniref:glycosyltransferase n=1 Tax=Listeria innocua TaxID=1642 RepID=UPI001625424F|nr:glycosyltransferase [Listeria innocua]MBC1904825.1 glycosyltransferase [Listeria innocua]